MDSKTVLLVDPHEDSRRIYHAILAHRGYRVLHAGEGEEGLRLAREGAPDLIATELWIPGVHGLDLLERLRGDERTARIPVVVITASPVPEDRRRAAHAGCAAYLAKPCSPTRMVAVVEALLGGLPLPHAT